MKLKFQKAQNKCIRFCLNLPSRFQMDPLHFRKIIWLLVRDKKEYCIVNTVFKHWNGIVPGYIHEMFKPSLYKCSTRSQVALDIPGRKNLCFLGPKIWSKIDPSMKNVRTASCFTHALKKNILLHLQSRFK